MEQIFKSVTRKWGNSLGIVIPLNVIKEENLKENREVTLKLVKKSPFEELFGSVKFKRPVKEIVRKLKKECDI
ncbi:AbrB/MazE/SpoVT family DNA-binding domain-containing protein [Candidatus Pacearchaeota archaeon]|nr:AbrB/MazE/SpoVT family DNA-binding domain-containing protein [Candidatus Pacearchaeota archaeon]